MHACLCVWLGKMLWYLCRSVLGTGWGSGGNAIGPIERGFAKEQEETCDQGSRTVRPIGGVKVGATQADTRERR